MYYSIQDFIENGIANLEECEKSLMKNPLNWTDQILGIQQILRKFGAAVISELLEECNTILENSIKRRAFWRIKDRTKKHLLTWFYQYKSKKFRAIPKKFSYNN